MQDQTGRRATAEKIGTENGLAPCALLLMFGRTVGLSLSIRSIPPAEQEMNLSANMIKAEGLWRTVGREYEGKGRPNRKAGKEKNGPPMNGKGVPRGRSHLGLLDFAEQRHSRLSHIICAPIPDSATSGGTIDKQGVWLTRTKE